MSLGSSRCLQPSALATEAVAPGLADLMVNAVEHGNLGVTYKDRRCSNGEGQWEAEIARRLALPRSGSFCVGVLRALSGPHRILITDQGEGFDWKKYLDFDPERAFDPNGRGIAIAKMMSFTEVEYRGRGNAY